MLELFTTILIFLYIPPEDSVFNSSKLVTQLDNMIELHLQKGNSIHIFGVRVGDMNEIFNMTYSQNIDESKNKNGDIFGVLYENRNIYPINHLKTREIEFTGNFTFTNKNGTSQVDFLFTNNFKKVKYFDIMDDGLLLSDHKILKACINVEFLDYV